MGFWLQKFFATSPLIFSPWRLDARVGVCESFGSGRHLHHGPHMRIFGQVDLVLFRVKGGEVLGGFGGEIDSTLCLVDISLRGRVFFFAAHLGRPICQALYVQMHCHQKRQRQWSHLPTTMFHPCSLLQT